MAHSSNYARVAADRSRSRDDPSMLWSNPTPARPHNQYRDSWHYNPPLRHTRRVLVIVNLEQVRPLMNAHHCDPMEATTCRELPSLGRLEEYALFTYSFLVHPAQTQTLTVDIMLYYISQHITYTWDCYLEPSSMDLRWQDSTGDTFVLRNGQILIDLLREHRPHWTEGQDQGLLNTIRNFDNTNQPHIMRLSCHEALPNPNMLPWLSSDKMTVLPDSICPLCAFSRVFSVVLLLPLFMFSVVLGLSLYHDQMGFRLCRH